jgi:hypothetical protein
VTNQNAQEYLLEIDSLMKTLNVLNVSEIKSHGIIESLQKPNSFLSKAIRQELEHLHKRVKLILPATAAPPPAAEDASASADQPVSQEAKIAQE